MSRHMYTCHPYSFCCVTHLVWSVLYPFATEATPLGLKRFANNWSYLQCVLHPRPNKDLNGWLLHKSQRLSMQDTPHAYLMGHALFLLRLQYMISWGHPSDVHTRTFDMCTHTETQAQNGLESCDREGCHSKQHSWLKGHLIIPNS